MKKQKKNVNTNQEQSPLKAEERVATVEESLDKIALSNDESIESFSSKVEGWRKEFFRVYSKQRKLSNFLMPVVGLIMAASFILFITVKQVWSMAVGGSLIGVTLVGMIIFYIVTRSKLPNLSREYLRNFAISSNSYVTSNNNIKNANLYFKKRYAVSDFLPDRVYTGIVDIASRNIVNFDYKEHAIEMGEVALYKQGEKRHQKGLLFVGRYLSFTNDYHFEDRYIINIRGKEDTDAPTDIEDLVTLKTQNRFSVYGKDGAKFEKDLDKQLINDLMSIDCTGSLLNVNIVLWAGHTAVYLSYDDAIVAIPLDKELKTESYKQLKKNIAEILEILVK